MMGLVSTPPQDWPRCPDCDGSGVNHLFVTGFPIGRDTARSFILDSPAILGRLMEYVPVFHSPVENLVSFCPACHGADMIRRHEEDAIFCWQLGAHAVG